MSELTAFLQLLQSLSPLAIIALLAVIIFLLVRGDRKVQSIGDNHLHDLSDHLATITGILQRIEVKLGTEFSYIKARLNGEK